MNEKSLRRRCLAVWLSCLGCFVAGLPVAAQSEPGYQLALVGLDGSREVLTILPRNVFAPRVSPDGRRIAYETFEVSERSGPAARLWVADLERLEAPRELPLVAGPMNWAPMWPADGERLVFLVSGERPDAIFVRRADGTGEARRLVDARSAEVQIPGSSQLTFLTLRADGDYGISMVDLDSGDVTPLVDLPGSAQHSSNVSPDGRWVAYASNETGRYEVWVEPLPPTSERHRATRNGGAHPMWSRDGAAIYFDRDHRLYEVAVTAGDALTFGAEKPLPISGFEQGEYRRQFDLMPNGRQFLLLIAVE